MTTTSSAVTAALGASQEAVRLERRRNRVVVWSVVVVLLFNGVFVVDGVWRDRQRTQTINTLANTVRGLSSTNETLRSQLVTQSVSNDKALTDAFSLLNQLRDVVSSDTQQSANNTNEIRVLEAYIQALKSQKPGQVVVRPVILTPPVVFPPPIVLAPQTHLPAAPVIVPVVPPKPCLVIIITLLC